MAECAVVGLNNLALDVLWSLGRIEWAMSRATNSSSEFSVANALSRSFGCGVNMNACVSGGLDGLPTASVAGSPPASRAPEPPSAA